MRVDMELIARVLHAPRSTASVGALVRWMIRPEARMIVTIPLLLLLRFHGGLQEHGYTRRLCQLIRGEDRNAVTLFMYPTTPLRRVAPVRAEILGRWVITTASIFTSQSGLGVYMDRHARAIACSLGGCIIL